MSFVVRGLLGAACVACPGLAQAQSVPAPPPAANTAPAPVRVYMRNEGGPLTYSAQSESGHAPSTWCISPCEAQLAPGDYRLKLNGLKVDDTLKLRRAGTLRGEYHSRAGTRSAAWLSLNIGGIIGGVFLTVGLAGGSKNNFYVGAGVLAAATGIFFITYRTDRATVSFVPELPPDVHDMPDPGVGSGARHASLDRPSWGSTPRGLGFRVAF
jgi:hypothetical protein